uniref:Uncharacterized protein n=1 Tax=Physcomitrium patens TaxID=3218 RepID=A0A2K1ICF5_PHYPA|nr:hypothetical protein PHYPA_030443 [Physcomitrium patens]
MVAISSVTEDQALHPLQKLDNGAGKSPSVAWSGIVHLVNLCFAVALRSTTRGSFTLSYRYTQVNALPKS